MPQEPKPQHWIKLEVALSHDAARQLTVLLSGRTDVLLCGRMAKLKDDEARDLLYWALTRPHVRRRLQRRLADEIIGAVQLIMDGMERQKPKRRRRA